METVSRLQRCITIVQGIRIAPRALPLSVSAGVTEVHPDDNLEAVVARADLALYQAKQTRATALVAHNRGPGVAP